MKVDIFKKLIREVIREELDFSLKRLEKSLQESIVRNKVTKIYEEAPKADVYTELQNKLDSQRVPSNSKPIVQTGNQVLNDILAETKNSGEWKTIQNEAETQSVNENTSNLPDHLANAFTKDYSKLMKHDKMKGKNGA